MFKYILMALLITNNAFAENNHNNNTTTVDITIETTSKSQPVETNMYITNDSSRGIALAIAASQHNFDFGTDSWQGSVGVGSYKDNNASSFAIGKRYGRVLFSGSISTDNDDMAYGAGINWRF